MNLYKYKNKYKHTYIYIYRSRACVISSRPQVLLLDPGEARGTEAAPKPSGVSTVESS